MDFSKHGSGTTSVKVHHQPGKPILLSDSSLGGASSFSLGGGYEEPPKPKPQQAQQQQPSGAAGAGPGEEAKTSVRVHHQPGGASNFSLGSDDNTQAAAQYRARGQASQFSLGGDVVEPAKAAGKGGKDSEFSDRNRNATFALGDDSNPANQAEQKSKADEVKAK